MSYSTVFLEIVRAIVVCATTFRCNQVLGFLHRGLRAPSMPPKEGNSKGPIPWGSIPLTGLRADYALAPFMKVVSSIKSAKKRHPACQVVRRKGKIYVINKVEPRYKARQG